MKKFTQLFENLDQAKSEVSKIQFLGDYFSNTPDPDKIWTIYLLSGKKIKRQITLSKLKSFALEFSGLSEWIFDESHKIVGDSSETLTLILPPPTNPTQNSFSFWIDFILQFQNFNEIEKKRHLFEGWNMLNQPERFIFNKLILGSFRSPVSVQQLVQAFSKNTHIETSALIVKLNDDWSPVTTTFELLAGLNDNSELISKPYPFCPIQVLDKDVSSLGNPENWHSEWNFGGIRSQLISRNNEIFLWSESGDLINNTFPEIETLRDKLPDGFVLEGELIVLKNEKTGSANLSKLKFKNQSNESPFQSITFIANDILELNGTDIQLRTYSERRLLLTKVIESIGNLSLFQISQKIDFKNWEELNQSRSKARDYFAETILLKKLASTGNESWVKWKPDLLSVYGILIYAQKDEKKPTDVFNTFTFGVRNERETVIPFAKTMVGLSDSELREINLFIKNNTIEKFGPVRTLKPELVFEIGFEGISPSGRHKSGVSVRSPRILSWKKQFTIQNANNLERLKQFLK